MALAAVCAVSAGCSRQPPPKEPVKQTEPATPAPAAKEPPDDRPVIVAFGNSLTAGLGVDADSNYPAYLQKEIDARGWRYRVVNAGVSGDTTGGGLARLGEVLAYQPKIVVVELGANDGLRGLPLETTRANLEQIVATLEREGARVVLAGMTLPPNYGADYVRGFEKIFIDLAAKYKTPRIPFLLDNVAARPGLMLSDALHPNAAGYRVVAANVMKTLEPLLR